MYKIAICDDDKSYLSIIRDIIIVQSNFPGNVEFYYYPSGEALLLELHKEFDLIFLDIKLEGTDGNQTAKELREHYTDPVLIFCTGTQRPTPDSFKVQPYRFILKHPRHKYLYDEMEQILEHMLTKKKADTIGLPFQSGIYQIKAEDILYVTTRRYGSNIHTSEKAQRTGIPSVFTTRNHINQIQKQLENAAEGMFGMPQRGYLVNYNIIIKMEKSVLHFADIKINISRIKKEEFEKRLLRYMKYKTYGKRTDDGV